MLRVFLFVLSVSTAAAASSSSSASSAASAAAPAGAPAGGSRDQLTAAWEAYVNETISDAPHGLQTGCRPLRIASSQTEAKGTILLFHGYSACPQQYLSLAPKLAAEGYDVLLPLNPGSGNDYHFPSNGSCVLGFSKKCGGPLDDATHLPQDTQHYTAFVARMVDILHQGPINATYGVAGISLGGSLAARAGFDRIFNRQLIMNPLMMGASKAQDAFLRALNFNPLTRHQWLGWGAGCRQERAFGRGGICSFQVSHMAAARDFGVNMSKTVSTAFAATEAQVLVLYDRKDPVVSTPNIRTLVQDYNRLLKAPAQSCVMNFTMHSMLSLYDDDGQNKWWLPELECGIVGFLTRGRPFPVGTATDPTEGNDPFCGLACSASSCPPYLHNTSAPPPPTPDCSFD